MENIQTLQVLSALLFVFPLIGFLITGLLMGQKKGNESGIIASTMVLLNFVISVILFTGLNPGLPKVETLLFNWIKVADISIPFSITVDNLSALMLLIVNGVGLLIHIYSIGYMKGDDGVNRFFSYFNLFIFFMLVLVLSSNYLMLFIGWEGVGLSSYLLIGFWYKDHANNDAAKKAFIMNRIGDLGFLVGMFMIFTHFGTLTISEVATQASSIHAGDRALLLITLCLFIGATGKSAQIPLFTWLPDAMAGPTPVSALIHAATMVTAGIYLVARSSVLFVLSPVTMQIILVIGVLTAIVGGLIAIYQNDIKKVLAYSTVSQLGFMFMALGLGSFSGAMFHLTTHAFFKALLFLAAGSVIHALSDEQDIRKMGGLKKKIPLTFAVFLIGTIAISGIPPFAGFFSKEMILTAAYEHGMAMGLIATFISLLTTIYMFRLLFVVFYKQESAEVSANHHIHESPKVMTWPLVVLATLSAIAGFIQMPALFGEVRLFDNYLSPVFTSAKSLIENAEEHFSIGTEWLILIVPLALIGLLVWICYQRFAGDKAFAPVKGIQQLFAGKFYVDEIYDFLFVRPTLRTSLLTRETIDQQIINRVINNIGFITVAAGKKLRLVQTGNIGFYLIVMVLSIVAVLFYNLIF
ncbi:NADH-quinone oxidoreductase subunit L [Parabacteroides sp. FAFU027]|uniref:NADH-quinone oxidoreductase subunit L n=1 Tax=Parabacteroides sp. FAFU027 TaxID=2922715 RepID=UPI001FAEC196|nr:NADH-quinone oxidoreductase subunit L [Parabacteroides sp. FAFU027]